nr:MAG: hypothetical protein [Aspergillus flavus vivivirus 1]
MVLTVEELARACRKTSATEMCPCYEGNPPYLELFPEAFRDRAFGDCGCHPNINELQRAFDAYGLPNPWHVRLAKAGHGVIPFVDYDRLSTPFVESIIQCRGVRPEDLEFVREEVRCMSSVYCEPEFDYPIHKEDGYCYLNLYPRTERMRIAREVGPWPAIADLPEGRFPVPLPEVVCDVLVRGKLVRSVHVEPQWRRCEEDELVNLPPDVCVGGWGGGLTAYDQSAGADPGYTSAGTRKHVFKSAHADRDVLYLNQEFPPEPGKLYQPAAWDDHGKAHVPVGGVTHVRVDKPAWSLLVEPDVEVAFDKYRFRGRGKGGVIYGRGLAHLVIKSQSEKRLMLVQLSSPVVPRSPGGNVSSYLPVVFEAKPGRVDRLMVDPCDRYWRDLQPWGVLDTARATGAYRVSDGSAVAAVYAAAGEVDYADVFYVNRGGAFALMLQPGVVVHRVLKVRAEVGDDVGAVHAVDGFMGWIPPKRARWKEVMRRSVAMAALTYANLDVVDVSGGASVVPAAFIASLTDDSDSE